MKIQIIKLSEKYGGFIDSEFKDLDCVRCSFVNCDSELLCGECILNNGDEVSRGNITIKEIEL